MSFFNFFRLGFGGGKQAQNHLYTSDSANQSEPFITSDNHAFVVKK